MMSLTTAQRDLLRQLLTTSTPISAAALGEELHLTPRQVQYGLRAIKNWLEHRKVPLHHTTGVGVQVTCAPERRQGLLRELESYTRLQLILTPQQRQQLLALQLLAASKTYTLGDFQYSLAVARSTILKDLDAIEPWLQGFHLVLRRRQHRGCWIDGTEMAKRQALAALLWGDVPFERPIMSVQQRQELAFVFASDAELLPIVRQINDLLPSWDLASAQDIVTRAETALGGYFSDAAAVQLILVCAIQQQRINARQFVVWDATTMRWVQAQATWLVAGDIAVQLWPDLPDDVRMAETATLALLFSSTVRDEPWHDDLASNTPFHDLIDNLLGRIAEAYRVPELAHDRLLRDGLEAHILPACVRQRFGLWAAPSAATDTHTERYTTERTVAAQLADAIEATTALSLPPDAHEDLILLLRAAILRVLQPRARHVLVVCPSGMATTQLLLARLRARFPRLGTFEVLPLRELSAERIADADLIIATVPITLPTELTGDIDILQVHPMLRPEDIVALTHLMT
ncbi:MAG: helix-turn-helix domain-containing protein [Chloroflexota bacterium]